MPVLTQEYVRLHLFLDYFYRYLNLYLSVHTLEIKRLLVCESVKDRINYIIEVIIAIYAD